MTSAPPDSKSPSKPENTIYPDYCHTLSPTIGKWVPLSARDIVGGALRDVGVYCDGKKLYHYNNHPIKWVKVTGVVVAVDEFKEKKRVFTVDDGSGCVVECTGLGAPTSLYAAVEEKKDVGMGGQKHLQQLAQLKTEGEKGRRKAEEEKNKQREVKKDEKITTPSVQNPIIPWAEIDIGTIIKVKGRVNPWWNVLQVEAIKIEVLKGLDAEVKSWNEVREFKKDVLGKQWVITKEEEEKCRMVKEEELRGAEKRKKGKGKEKDMSSRERKDKPLKDGYDGENKKRKDLERIQRVDGVVKRRIRLTILR